MTDPMWEELERKTQRADGDAWGRVMPLWPEATGGDADPWFSHVYGIVMRGLAAQWLALNHPDPVLREKILQLVYEEDLYFESRGHPQQRSAAQVSVKDWRPSPRTLRDRVEQTVDRILELFFEGLMDEYPGATNHPIAPELISRFRPCVTSFLLHWLGYNHPDQKGVEELADRYVREDPFFFDRCGAGGEA